jgi:hypothetical protein
MNFLFGELSRGRDADSLRRLPGLSADRLNRFHDIKAFDYFSKHSMFAYKKDRCQLEHKPIQHNHDKHTIKPRSSHRGNKKLRSLCVRTSIGHAQVAFLRVLDLEVFVFEHIYFLKNKYSIINREQLPLNFPP